MSLINRLSTLAAVSAGAFLALTTAQAGDLVEYYHKDLDHFFVTGYVPEIQALDTGTHKGWARTGLTIQTFDAGNMPPNSVPVCRFYGNPARGLDSHFYSASPDECALVKQKWPLEWLLESDEVFRVHAVNPNTGLCPAATKPVYRLYNKRADINHRYSTDPAVVDAMIAKGYVLEGNGSPQRPVVFCAANLPPAQPVAGAPLCALTASTAFPIINTPVTLTATCTESPTSYGWINCTGTGNTCIVNASAVGIVNYGVVGINSRGTSAPASLALNWGVAASAAPTCTVSASTTTPTLGTSLSLLANCSHAPSNYQWLGCSALLIEACNLLSECSASTTACTPIGSQVGPVFYALVASNSAGASSKVGLTVDWRSGGSGTPPPPSTPMPHCTLTASSTTPAVNTNILLTASCNNSPTSYQWTNCASTGQTCTTTETGLVTRIYRVAAGNASGMGAPAEVTVNWQQPPTAPPVCTLTPSSTTPYINGTLTLTANCTQSPTTFQWTGCSSTGPTCSTTTATTGPATYSVTASNQFGPGSPASAGVTWQAPPPGGGPGFCGHFSDVRYGDLVWGGQLTTGPNGGIVPGTLYVARLRVPATATSPNNYAGSMEAVEFPDAPAERVVTLSTQACDFRGWSPGAPVFPGGDPSGGAGPLAWSGGNVPNFSYLLAGDPPGFPPKMLLEPGQTYFVNVQTIRASDGQNSCTAATCNLKFTVRTPS